MATTSPRVGHHFDDSWRQHVEPGPPAILAMDFNIKHAKRVEPGRQTPTAGAKETIAFIASWVAAFDLIEKPRPKRTKPIEPATGVSITEAEVVAICRDHFTSFGSLDAAAAHYCLTKGRLAQIQTGKYVGCPRILSVLGIKRYHGGDYRLVGDEVTPDYLQGLALIKT